MPYTLSISNKSQTFYDGPLGFSWDHSYNQKLIENTNGSVVYLDGKL